MKVVFYSTNPSNYDANVFHFTNLPSNNFLLSKLKQVYPEVKFYIFTQKPGMFFLDLEGNNLIKHQDFEYFISETSSPEFFAQEILKVQPDLVISASFWQRPFDWHCINDSMVKEILESYGIKTICHSANTSFICFHKGKTCNFLKNNSFNVAKSFELQHELFWAERNNLDVKENVYKNYAMQEIQKMKLPLVIKDCTGFSSYGIELVKTYGQAKNFLLSKKNNSDRLIEEYIDGLQFGTEIHGSNGNYKIYDPFMFSVNQYGITSPKQSVKLGPFNSEKYNIPELKKELLRLSKLLDFSGIAQVDLVFKDGKWYIIEINTRLSGMTQLIAVYEKSSIPELLMRLALNNVDSSLSDVHSSSKEKYLCVKIEPQEFAILEKLKTYSFVEHVSQVKNDAAKQQRENGYCELILSFTKEAEVLEAIQLINKDFPLIIDESFIDSTKAMLKLF